MEPTEEQRREYSPNGSRKPAKTQITLRLDADVVEWFRASTLGGRGYQTEINRVLREHVLGNEKKKR